MEKSNAWCSRLKLCSAGVLTYCLISCSTSGGLIGLQAPPPVGNSTSDRCELNINGKRQKEYRLNHVLPGLTFDNQGDIGSCYAYSLCVAMVAQGVSVGHLPVSCIDLMFLSPSARPLKKAEKSDKLIGYFDGGNTCTIFEEAKKKGYCLKSDSILEKAEQDKKISSLTKSQFLRPLLSYYNKLMDLPFSEREGVLKSVRAAVAKAQVMSEDAKIDPQQITIENCEEEGAYVGLVFYLPLLKSFLPASEKPVFEKYFGSTDKSKVVEIQVLSPELKQDLKKWYPAWVKSRQQKLKPEDFYIELRRRTGLPINLSGMNKDVSEIMNMISTVFLTMDSYYDEKVCENAKLMRELDRKTLARKTKDQIDACVIEKPDQVSDASKDLAKSLGVDSISLFNDKLMSTLIDPKLNDFHSDFQKMFLPDCTGKRIPVEANRCEQFNNIEQVVSELGSNRVVMTTLEMGVFYADTPAEIRAKSNESDFSYHSVAIKAVRGQRAKTGECEPYFLIHNSWGGACTGTMGKLTAQYCNEATGEFWIPGRILEIAKGSFAPFQVLK